MIHIFSVIFIRIFNQNPCKLTFAVAEESGKFFQGQCLIMMLHVGQNQCDIMTQIVDSVAEDNGAVCMTVQNLGKQHLNKRNLHLFLIRMVTLCFTKKLDDKRTHEFVCPGVEQQIAVDLILEQHRMKKFV